MNRSWYCCNVSSRHSLKAKKHSSASHSVSAVFRYSSMLLMTFRMIIIIAIPSRASMAAWYPALDWTLLRRASEVCPKAMLHKPALKSAKTWTRSWNVLYLIFHISTSPGEALSSSGAGGVGMVRSKLSTARVKSPTNIFAVRPTWFDISFWVFMNMLLGPCRSKMPFTSVILPSNFGPRLRPTLPPRPRPPPRLFARCPAPSRAAPLSSMLDEGVTITQATITQATITQITTQSFAD